MARIAVLSDIHGNCIALDAVLEHIRRDGGADAFWILGDLSAIGYDPVGVLARLNGLPDVTIVRGNTDRYAVTGERPGPTPEQCQADPEMWPARVLVASSLSWTQGALRASGWADWMAELPLEFRTVLPDGTRVLCVHAAPGSDDALGLHPATSQDTLRSMAAQAGSDLLLVGHTHWAMSKVVDGVQLVNAGSVSNPFPPDLRASYLLLEADETATRLEQRRVAYDHQAVVDALHRVGHPAAGYIAGHMSGEHLPFWSRPRQ
jgi:predicted phosphodiesterase